MENIKKLSILITLQLSFFGLFSVANAQEYELVSDYSKNTQILFLDTKGVDINAIEGVVKIGDGDYEEVNLSTEGSIVPIWLSSPTIIGRDIIFEGVLPGGFNGRAILFSFSGGNIKSSLSGLVYLNDGLGTSKKVTVKYREATIEEKNVISTISENIEAGVEGDLIPPEIFYPAISTSTDLFDGRLFVSFLTQDKQSGIDYYEVAEKRGMFKSFNYKKLDWQKAESPYLLNDQEGESFVYVKAVDRAGNERISVVSPLYTSLARIISIISIIILIIVTVAFVLRKFINDKRNKNFSS